MIHFYCIALLVLCGQVELFKLGLLSGPATSQDQHTEQYFRQSHQYGYEQPQQIYAGRPQSLPYQPSYQQAYQQPYNPPLAYVIVRPVVPSYPYYDSSVRYWSPLQQTPAAPAPVLDASGVKGGERQLQPAPATFEPVPATKGGSSRPEYIRQEKVEFEQHPLPAEPIEQPLPSPPAQLHQQSDQLYDMGMGKLLKIKSSFDKFKASAMSKLTMGSYHVAGEEYIPPAAPQQPLRQEQLQAGDIQLTKLEQQRIEDAGQTKLETQQQHLEEAPRQTKLEETSFPIQQSKFEESRGTKLVQEEAPRQTKLEEAPRLEETRQEKLAEPEPLRETKGQEQLPLQQQQQQHLQQERYPEKGLTQERYPEKGLTQERYAGKGLTQERYAEKGLTQERYPEKGVTREHYQSEKGLQQQQQQQFHQQREEHQQGALKTETRDQIRFNGQQQQQPTTYLSGHIDSDGFGKRQSAI